MKYSHLFAILFALMLLASCAQEAAPTAEPTPAAVVQQPTNAPSATPTPDPTATPTTEPSATPEPTATTEPTATSEPTATPGFYASAEDFGEDRNPLTGELVDDPEQLQRRPIAVKISNYPAGYVRPQSGLSQADIVYEHLTEGAITRFTAIIYGDIPPRMGPIRSGRLIDLEIPLMYDSAFAYSGSSIGVAHKLGESEFNNRILRSGARGYYRTGDPIPYEHTFYGEPALWYEVLDERELNTPPRFRTYMAFSEEPPAGGEPASQVNIAYREVVVVDWEYDEETGRYLRWTDGEPHIDRNTEEQLSAANVVIVFATHVIDYSICEHQVGDQCLAYSVEIQIWGEGPAIIVRDGQQFEATWVRAERHDMLTFSDDEGNPVPLQIGNSWFQIVPYHYDDPVTIEP